LYADDGDPGERVEVPGVPGTMYRRATKKTAILTNGFKYLWMDASVVGGHFLRNDRTFDYAPGGFPAGIIRATAVYVLNGEGAVWCRAQQQATQDHRAKPQTLNHFTRNTPDKLGRTADGSLRHSKKAENVSKAASILQMNDPYPPNR
jgi:hypothetical protein